MCLSSPPAVATTRISDKLYRNARNGCFDKTICKGPTDSGPLDGCAVWRSETWLNVSQKGRLFLVSGNVEMNEQRHMYSLIVGILLDIDCRPMQLCSTYCCPGRAQHATCIDDRSAHGSLAFLAWIKSKISRVSVLPSGNRLCMRSPHEMSHLPTRPLPVNVDGSISILRTTVIVASRHIPWRMAKAPFPFQ